MLSGARKGPFAFFPACRWTVLPMLVNVIEELFDVLIF